MESHSAPHLCVAGVAQGLSRTTGAYPALRKRRNPWTKDLSLCGCSIGGRHHRAPRYLILSPGPRAGAIRETKLTLGRLNVAQGESETTPLAGSSASATTTQKTSVNIQGDDILPNSPTFSTLARPTTISTWVLRLFGLLIPVFLVLGVDWQIRRRDEESNDIWKKRKRLALSTVLTGLSQAENNPAELSKVIRNFLGDCVSITGASLTTTELLEALDKAAWARTFAQNTATSCSAVITHSTRRKTQSTLAASRNG